MTKEDKPKTQDKNAQSKTREANAPQEQNEQSLMESPAAPQPEKTSKTSKRKASFWKVTLVLAIFAASLSFLYMWSSQPSQFATQISSAVTRFMRGIDYGIKKLMGKDVQMPGADQGIQGTPKSQNFDNAGDSVGGQHGQALEKELQNPVYFEETNPYEKEPIVRAVKKALPSVVSIAINNAQVLPGQIITNQDKIGSGFIVDQKGIIATNKHVVQRVNIPYKVITNDGKSYEVIDILQDPVYDLAFVFINPGKERLTAVSLGDSDKLELGQTVIAIGTPFGQFPSTVTSGIISGLNRKVEATDTWDFAGKIYTGVIQTDAAINPGNSGGPLLDLYGNVIGVNFAKIAGADNVSFAIPINIVKMRLSQYKQYGHFVHPFLGVSVQHIDPAMAAYYGVPAGALVVQVVPGSPAANVGIRPSDIITHVDDQPVSEYGLVNIINTKKVGDIVKLRIARPVKDKTTGKTEFKVLEFAVKLVDRAEFEKRLVR